MKTDPNGFSCRVVTPRLCIDCGKCQAVCPVLSHTTPSDTLPAPELFACWNRDPKIRFKSSSGGLFSVFAEKIIAKNGVVYGAVFDPYLKTVFARTETSSGLEPMRGSKYVEAETGTLFKDVAADLRHGISVLFSGTPCQNAALKSYLVYEGCENLSLLFQIDFICHGVSPPALWQSFVAAVEAKYQDKLRNVLFRDKSIGGWKSPAMRFIFRNRKDVVVSWSTVLSHTGNAFIHCYHKNIMLKNSCLNCFLSGFPRQGDITLADAQALYHRHEFASEARNGISMVLINTSRGKRLFEESAPMMVFHPRPLAEIGLPANPATPHPQRVDFLRDAEELDFVSLFQKYRSGIAPPIRLGTCLNSFFKTILGPKTALRVRENVTSLFHFFKRKRK